LATTLKLTSETGRAGGNRESHLFALELLGEPKILPHEGVVFLLVIYQAGNLDRREAGGDTSEGGLGGEGLGFLKVKHLGICLDCFKVVYISK
jgi:hypothetical protein